MTLFLASVADADEAETVLAGGADIIDAKDAAAGALGALPPPRVRDIVTAVAGRRPVSAVIGDLPMEPDVIVAAAREMAETGVDTIKVGLFADPARPDCIRALSRLAGTTKIVGVMFADLGADQALVQVMRDAGFAGAMLDTARKGSGGLLDHADVASLRNFIAECRAHRLIMVGLAGSLETPDIPRLLLLEPDLLGFRGALCAGQDRTAAIDAESVRVVRDMIPVDPRSAGYDGSQANGIDYRLLAARGYSVDPASDDTRTDRIFVHDLVLAVRVGAYARERQTPQRVRFNVDAQILRSGRAAEDMRDVVSYDLVTDGIRMLVAQEHITLLETLAERIAALVLTHDRVARVTVRVEKLDIGPQGVGVEIARERSAEIAKVHQLYPPRPGADAKAAE